MHCRVNFLLPLFLSVFFSLVACRHQAATKKKDIVADPAKMDAAVQDNIIADLASATGEVLHDSTTVAFLPVLKYYYDDNGHLPLWSSREQWNPNAAALIRYLDHASDAGLFSEDYHYAAIKSLREQLMRDSVKRKDAVRWARADIMMTDALVALLRDLKQGRLLPDSVSWKYNAAKYSDYFSPNLEKIRAGEPLDSVLAHVEPKIREYVSLKALIRNFTDSMDTRRYTFLDYPWKDSLAFLRAFRKRLAEQGIPLAADADSAAMSMAVKKYQKIAAITVDGKIGAGVVKSLNFTDREKFKTIAVTLDRYKSLPEVMPAKYVWVNLPAYYLRVWNADTMVFESKVICGKPATPTPFLTSAITDIIIYPTWTVPEGIISKDMLPGLKRNSAYLSRKGMYLLNNAGERVDPYSVNWARFSKSIPFRIQQGSGDDNALGVIKFNFNNPFSVYLHDTNQRYLFKNGVRDLSHGCVRVQEWEKLADYIVRNDSSLAKRNDTLRYNADSISNWISRKEKHTIVVKNRLPLFIKYFSCEAVNGRIKFYDDIYGDDRALAGKYFAGK